MANRNKEESRKRDVPTNKESEAFLTKKSNLLQLTYFIDDNPPWPTSILLGFQHYLTMFGGTVALPLLLAKFLCAGNNGLAKSQLICTIFFVSGIATILQTSVGVRLPIVQGGTFSFLAPTLAILTLPKWKCPAAPQTDLRTAQNATLMPNLRNGSYFQGYNSSCWKNICVKNESFKLTPTTMKSLAGKNNSTMSPLQSEEDKDIWMPRMREIQGAIIVSSLLQIVIGATGSMGVLMKHIGPLTVTPAIALIGLSLFDVAAEHASEHWGIAILTMFLVILFSQYLRKIKVPVPAYSKAKGFHKKSVKFFELFPVLLAIMFTWLLCVILTAAGCFEPGHPARSDTRSQVLYEAPWFRVPYPGQWGTPTVSIAAVIGMMAGVMAGIIESVGDYYACARLSGAPPVPKHAMNRGVLIEGLCCLLAGAFGSGAGTTSYSENIGAIGITKVGSRRVLQVGGLFMLVLAVFSKFGALFATIPEPIIGGVFIVMFGMVAAVGISNLQFVDLNSVRNLFIIGFSLFIGLVIPKWIHSHKDAIDTGSPELDQVLHVLLETSMWVGGMVGFFLDVTLPGTDEERGISKWGQLHKPKGSITQNVASVHTYDIPYVTPFLQNFPFVRYIPFLPYYGEGGDEDDHRGEIHGNKDSLVQISDDTESSV